MRRHDERIKQAKILCVLCVASVRRSVSTRLSVVSSCVDIRLRAFPSSSPLPNDYTFAETSVISYFADIAESQKHSNIHAINEE